LTFKQELTFTQEQLPDRNAPDPWKKYAYQLKRRLKILVKWANDRGINTTEFLVVLEDLLCEENDND